MSQLPRKARHQTGENIKDLVCAIRNSGRRCDQAALRLLAIQDANNIRSPRVHVGYHLKGNGEREDVYAHSHDEIDQHRKPHADALLDHFTPWHRRIAFALAGNIQHAKLQREIEEAELRERETGAADWRERWQKALAEYKAALAEFLKSRPQDVFEANLKISFLASLIARDLVDGDAIPTAIRNSRVLYSVRHANSSAELRVAIRLYRKSQRIVLLARHGANRFARMATTAKLASKGLIDPPGSLSWRQNPQLSPAPRHYSIIWLRSRANSFKALATRCR
jgi:hypothetical protein